MWLIAVSKHFQIRLCFPWVVSKICTPSPQIKKIIIMQSSLRVKKNSGFLVAGVSRSRGKDVSENTISTHVDKEKYNKQKLCCNLPMYPGVVFFFSATTEILHIERC